MRRTVSNILLTLMFGTAFAGSISASAFTTTAVEFTAPPEPEYEQVVATESAPLYTVDPEGLVDLSAAAWLIFDLETGEVIVSEDADTPRPVASVTKLSTAIAVLETADLVATTSIAYADTNTEGRAGNLVAGEVYNLYTLLFPLILESSNDAAAVFARIDTTFIDKLNSFAADLGLMGTAFADSSGLSPQNVATARDLAQLGHLVYSEYPHLLDISTLGSYKGATKEWTNNNPFVHEPGYLGGKHGYIPEAKLTTVSMFAETLADGTERSLGYVLLGSDDLRADMKALRNYARNYVAYE